MNFEIFLICQFYIKKNTCGANFPESIWQKPIRKQARNQKFFRSREVS